MDGSIAFRWTPRLILPVTPRFIFLLIGAVLLFVLALVGAFQIGTAAGRAETSPALSQPPATQPVTATAPSSFIDRSIRVLLLNEVEQFAFSIEQPFDVVDPEEKKTLLHCLPGPQLSARFALGGVRLVEYDRSFTRRVIDLVPASGGYFRLVTPKGARVLAGSLRLFPQGSMGDVVNVVDVETYLLGVVPAEALRGFHEQAMRSQAIIARTFAWYTKLTAGLTREYDVLANEGSQMYIGLAARQGLAEKAVRDTAGIVCTWASPKGERIFCTYYSSTCGGSTQDAGPVKNEMTIPPLAGRIRCDYCRASPFARWEPVRLEKSVITQRLREKYPLFRTFGRIESMEVVDATPEGRPVRFSLTDGEGRGVELEAENFRLSVDPSGRLVRSTFFVPVMERNAIVLTQGRGFGHGMGLCQYGADALADTGWSAAQILRFYYPGSHLTRAY